MSLISGNDIPFQDIRDTIRIRPDAVVTGSLFDLDPRSAICQRQRPGHVGADTIPGHNVIMRAVTFYPQSVVTVVAGYQVSLNSISNTISIGSNDVVPGTSVDHDPAIRPPPVGDGRSSGHICPNVVSGY